MEIFYFFEKTYYNQNLDLIEKKTNKNKRKSLTMDIISENFLLGKIKNTLVFTFTSIEDIHMGQNLQEQILDHNGKYIFILSLFFFY